MPGYTLSDGLTLKNLLGATSHGDPEKFEARFVRERLRQLQTTGLPRQTFDITHLKAIHHHLFQDVFEWAGRSRDEKVRLSDGTLVTEPVMRKPGGKAFLAGAKIETALARLFTGLHSANLLKGLSRAEFAQKAAVFLAGWNWFWPGLLGASSWPGASRR